MASNVNNELDSTTLRLLLDLVHKHTGINMTASKKSMLQGRLRPRLKALGLNTYQNYIDYLTSHYDETQEFINLVTTNETSFFRTERIWNFFSENFLPNWISKNPEKTLKIWSGASSSGEEIYTIAICCEEFRQRNPSFNFLIYATDISSDVLALAEKGIYSGRSIEAFKRKNPKLFEKYLELESGEYRFSADAVKMKITFKSHNLFHPPPKNNFYDLIFLRNVLIYFGQIDQEIVLKNMSTALVTQGTLIVGESESLSNLSTPFQYISPLVYLNGNDQVA